MVEVADHITIHKVSTCSKCGSSLKDIVGTYRLQKSVKVFDLRPIKVNVEEHRAEQKTCPYCGHLNKASFPEDITQPAQYGPRIKAILTYLNQYQLLPYERTSELFYDLFGTRLTASTIVNTNRACFEALKHTEEKI